MQFCGVRCYIQSADFRTECACKYGYIYVDISDVDTPVSVNPRSIGAILSISDSVESALIAHPTTTGYIQIADRVIEALKEDVAKDSSKTTVAFRKIMNFFLEFFNTIKKFFSNLF